LELTSRDRTTALLEPATEGERPSLDALLPLVYDELRSLAHGQLLGEATGHTLETTALVHEAYVRLVDDTRVTRKGRAYFFGAAARAMRQVLVDHARRYTAKKRGGGARPVSLDAATIAVDQFADELLDLDRALDALAERNARHARVVECRFFGGLSVEETAEALDVSPRTVKYDWALARAWLHDALHAIDPVPDDGELG
jgi:RNA polymerase sigma factor (TIGR02999 family)